MAVEFRDSKVIKSLTGAERIQVNRSLSFSDEGIASIDVADLANFVTPGAFFNTNAQARAATVSAVAQFIEIGCYSSVNDRGGGLYARSASQPANTANLRSADGAWWAFVGIPNDRAFGVIGDGVADDTAALQLAFTTCFAGGSFNWTAGNFKITSTLNLKSTSNVNSTGPRITTEPGVVINCNYLGNNPAIAIWNFDQIQTSPAGTLIFNGYLGDLTFTGNQPIPTSGYISSLPLQSGLSLRGISGWTFGKMTANYIGGSTVEMPQYTTQNGANPDPYNVAFCNFGLMTGNYIGGRVFNAANGVGEAGNTYDGFTGVFYAAGGVRCGGAANNYGLVSLTGYGWAIDIYGTASTTRNIWAGGEIDGAEYGIRFGGGAWATVKKFRFNHNNMGTSIEPTAACWPKIAVQYGSPTSALSYVEVQCEHRIDPGVTLANIGIPHDFRNDQNVSFVKVDIAFADNAGFTTPLTTIFQNIPTTNNFNDIRCNGLKYSTSQQVDYIHAKASAYTVTVGGFYNNSSKVTFDVVDSGRPGMWDAANFWAVMPYSGEIEVDAQITLPASVAAGTQVKLGLAINRAGIPSGPVGGVAYAPVGGGIFPVYLKTKYKVLAGDQVYLCCSLSSGSPAATTGIVFAREENYLGIKYVQ